MPSPLRTCVGCRRRRPQAELVRCAVTPDGRPVVDRCVAGRGAWLCPPPGECFELAMRRRGFERAWRRPLPDMTSLRAEWTGDGTSSERARPSGTVCGAIEAI